MSDQELRATAAMIQARWPGRWEGNLATRLEELTRQTETLGSKPLLVVHGDDGAGSPGVVEVTGASPWR